MKIGVDDGGAKDRGNLGSSLSNDNITLILPFTKKEKKRKGEHRLLIFPSKEQSQLK